MRYKRQQRRVTYLNFKKVVFYLVFTSMVLGLISLSPQNLFCQKTGYKYLNNYTPKEYDGHSQNWCIIQDKRGIIYVGNHESLLEFDGISWRKIAVPNGTVRSMALDEDGTIYIGGINEIGFLKPDSMGTLKYNSLLEHLKENQKDFADVWRTHATKEGIYFRTSNLLFRWDPISRKINAWEEYKYSFNASFVYGERFIIHKRGVGLMVLENNSLEMLPRGETFANMKIYMLVQYDTNRLLIGTRSQGFYIFDMMKKEKAPFPTEADNYLKEKQLYQGIRLLSSPGDIALVTLRGGLVIMDSEGKLKEIFNENYGLQTEEARYVFEDSQGNLWLGLNRGISKIEYISPISVYDRRSNLPRMTFSVIKHHQDMYVGTSNGLYYLSSPDKFIPVRGIPGNCWDLLSIGDSLLAATNYGVFQVENKNKIEREIIKDSSYVLLQSHMDTNRIWVGASDGLLSLYKKNGNTKSHWEQEHKFKDITEEIRTIVEDKKGNLWLGTLTKGVLKVDFPDDMKIFNPVITRYDTSTKLPPGEIHIFMATGQAAFATRKGIFRFNEKTKNFYPDPSLGEEFADGSRDVFFIFEDQDKNIWLHSDYRNYLAIVQPDGTYVLNKTPFLRIPPVQVNFIYPDPSEAITWFASQDEGLIRFDTTVKKNYQQDFPIFIRKVLVNEDLYFDGYKDKYKIDKGRQSKFSYPIFPYKDRNLRFEVAAPFFEDESSTRYQYFLEGYDKNWSPFTPVTQKDYTNLDSGLYTFRVRARNVYENLSQEAVFQFKILLPWYKTWWAFSIYATAAFILILLIVKWRSWKLVKEKQSLEQIIKERTKEINQKNQQLQEQTQQLKEQSEKLKEMDRMKSRFFANISHEFRTPLTLIMGPIEQMISTSDDKEQKRQLNLMFRSSQRLLALINQLLDLAKFDSGKMKLQAGYQNIIPFLKGILASFELLAQQHQLELKFITDKENTTLYFDPGKIEQVMCNLLINAVKFTPGEGKITVNVKNIYSNEDDIPFPAGFLEISVSDTGIGIPKEQLDHIFDRFYRPESSGGNLWEQGHEGTGIGLALAKELLELHHGSIHVFSEGGKGTEFIIRLPLGKEHLSTDEIVNASKAPLHLKKTCEITTSYMKETKEDVPLKEDAERNDLLGKNTDIEQEAREKYVIMIVDDSPGIREYIRRALEPTYTVAEAVNGREGIQKAKDIIPDLIISDIMMPEIDGYELCNTLKKDIETSHIPFILLTAKASEENIIQGLETGADDYITKPFNTKILCTRIKNLIELRRQWQMKIQRQKTLLPDEIAISSIDENFLNEFQAIIEKNLSDPDFNIHQLSKKLYMGRTSLFRKIEALTGQTPNQFIQSYRLHRAAQLLKANFGNITQVAFEVGFSSSAYFTKCFKEKFNQLPSTFLASESAAPGSDKSPKTTH
jgi:signal transduction histidine kinase/DNA-binding response OmpR family regulator/ligand-binding sensor domain-containing protein